MGVAPFHVGQRNLMNDLRIFVRTYDFLLWLMPQSQKFPRIYRFTLAERVQRLALDFRIRWSPQAKVRARAGSRN